MNLWNAKTVLLKRPISEVNGINYLSGNSKVNSYINSNLYKSQINKHLKLTCFSHIC